MNKQVEKVLRHVQLALPNLLAFCPLLDGIQQAACDQLGEAAVHLIGWAWQRRALLGPTRELLVVGFPPSWQPEASKVLGAWDQAVRSSSAVENWHSVLRPFIAVHRHLSTHMLPILAVWHNHRVASRGQNLGQSPLTRTGLAQQPTDCLAALGYAHLPSPSPQPIPSSIVRSSPEMESIAA